MSEYLPIESYGVVGNQETCALVGQNGSIDWLPLPYLDSASVFAGILDAERGGHFHVRPTAAYESDQQYVDETAVLETTFETEAATSKTDEAASRTEAATSKTNRATPKTNGETSNTKTATLTVTDFFPPIEGSDERPHRALYHKVTCEDGSVKAEFEFRPRFDYARAETELATLDGGVVATGHREWVFLSTDTSPDIAERTARATFSLDEDETRWFVLRYDAQSRVSDAECERQLTETVEHWHDWTHDCDGGGDCPYGGAWHELAVRSGMVLKMLATRETGAIAAAATTSLPEDIGGVRNWDYRFNWIRDSASTAQVLYTLGHTDVAENYHDWFMDLCSIDDPADIQPIQELHGQTDLDEKELDHLSGYRDSSPVRVGNDAASQRQMDTYGELLLAIDQTAHSGSGVSEERWTDLVNIVDYVCEHWDEKGSGIWELRTEPKQFTYSKLMCWTALDRGISMARRQDFDAPLSRWRDHREEIRTAIEERGYSDDRETFVQTFEDDEALDATSLLVPIVGFLPFDDERVRNTIDATVETLATDDGLVDRYDGDDGLPGNEGAFVRASFWLVNALALSGRVEEAESVFETAVEYVNPVGLLSEELDRDTQTFLGNFPQAYSHVGLSNSIMYLNYVRGRELSPEPIGVRLGRGGILDE